LRHNDTVSIWGLVSQETENYYNDLVEGEVDLAIIGGGYTGLSTALHCAEKGLSCHVFEAKDIGFGGSGRNVGLVNAGVWLPPQGVYKILGEIQGKHFLTQFSRAPEYVFSLIEKYQIQCEVARTGTIHAAHSLKGYSNLKLRKEEWDRLGEPVDLLSREEMASYSGSPAFCGGLLDHRAGTINPMAYCRGLARAARAAGASISCQTPVSKLERNASRWRVITPNGEIMARNVVIGTNAHTDELWPGLRRSIATLPYFQIATLPLGNRIKTILPKRQGLWDTGKIMFSLRRDISDRLIIGSMGDLLGSSRSGVSCQWARKQLCRLFPGLGPVEFEQAWQGQIAMTSDHLPHVHKLSENLYSAIGYNGRGITTGTIFGKALAGLLTGEGAETLPIPTSQLNNFKGFRIKAAFYKIAFAGNQLFKSI